MIIHLTTKTDWETAQFLGEYRAASLESQGFIHCSTAEQILGVANSFYQGVPDLILLWLDPARVKADVRWEAPIHPSASPADATPEENESNLFPHIYGPINLDAVVEITAFHPDQDGVFRHVRS